MKSPNKDGFNSIALRFSDNFAPEVGTIAAHQEVIAQLGFVWYGKLGAPVSNRVAEKILSLDNPRILLIRSGKQERYWAYVSDIAWKTPELSQIPSYYAENADVFRTWFRITRFEPADANVMSKCIVPSSGEELSKVSRSIMSPYFIIRYSEDSEGGT